MAGALFTQKGEKRKIKKGEGIIKTLASSKILTHGLGSLKGSPQCEREKKKSTAQRRSRCLDLVSSIISIEVKVKVKMTDSSLERVRAHEDHQVLDNVFSALT